MPRAKKTTAERYLEAFRKGKGVRPILKTARPNVPKGEIWIFPDGSCVFVKGTQPRIAKDEAEARQILERPE